MWNKPHLLNALADLLIFAAAAALVAAAAVWGLAWLAVGRFTDEPRSTLVGSGALVAAAAIAVAAHRIEGGQAFAGGHALQDQPRLASAVAGADQLDQRPAQCLVGRPAEDALGGTVPAGDGAVQ